MSTLTVTSSSVFTPSTAKYDKDLIVTIDEAELSEEEDGRTFHSTNAAYVLPNDNIEHQRLELQHRLLWQIMGNKVFHAPLNGEAIHKTLDIGCGTGAVTHEMASTFPDAKVFGADLSPIPQVRQKLSNIQYVQGDIMDIDQALFEQNSFDFVFSRLLVLGMSNWKVYVERCVSLTKPGHSSPWLWETTLGKLLALKDVDLYCGSKIPSLFAEAGLTDLRIKRYMVPYSRWEDLTEAERGFADYLETFLRDVIPVAIRKAGENAGPKYTQEVEEAIKDVERYYKAFEGGRNFLWMYVVCGRKPV
ncbi:hypothetical protein N0V86_004778 [Didymella sp. IMI 355093]|nr:hypothetical protein N0V86_004778 [Didymella sp. IMI 355093]